VIELHYYPGNASFTPHVLLHEIGTRFELKLVDRAHGAHQQPDYLKLNPNGQIPVLIDGDLVLYETAAICLYLVDKFPASALAPPVGSIERAQFYKWLVWLSNSPQALLKHYFYPDRMLDEGNTAGVAQLKAHAQAQVGGMLQQIDTQLAAHGGPWLLGTDYSAVDPYAFMLCRWTRGFDTRPAREHPHIAPYLQRLLQRPAVQRAFQAEGLNPPWV